MRRKSLSARHHRPGEIRGAWSPVAAGINLQDNPNRGKRHSARLATMEGFIADLARAESRAYRPLTVVTPALDKRGRRSPRSAPSQYRI